MEAPAASGVCVLWLGDTISSSRMASMSGGKQASSGLGSLVRLVIVCDS
jgi:hypothetical protein